MKKDRWRKTPFNPFEGPPDPEALAKEMLGRHYRFRRGDRRLSPSDALDILQSLHFVLATEPERLARLSAWSEAGEDTGRSLVAVLQAALADPAVGIIPVLWEGEIRLAAEANTAAFAEHPLDPGDLHAGTAPGDAGVSRVVNRAHSCAGTAGRRSSGTATEQNTAPCRAARHAARFNPLPARSPGED